MKCRKHKQIANFLYHNYTYLGYKINKKIVKNLRKQAQFFEIDKVNHYKLSDSTRQAIRRRDATIDDDALELCRELGKVIAGV